MGSLIHRQDAQPASHIKPGQGRVIIQSPAGIAMKADHGPFGILSRKVCSVKL